MRHSAVAMVAMLQACSPIQDDGIRREALLRSLSLDSVTIVWSLRGEDCFSCNTPARSIREVQQRQGSTVRFVAVLVDGDTVVMKDLLRAERIVASIVEMTESDYHAAFGNVIPSYAVLYSSRIVAIWPGSHRKAQVQDPASDLMRVLDSIRGSQDHSREYPAVGVNAGPGPVP